MNSHSFVVFKDEDTAANANIDFHMLNDDAHIFRETCTKLQTNHTMSESTVFYCSKYQYESGLFMSRRLNFSDNQI